MINVTATPNSSLHEALLHWTALTETRNLWLGARLLELVNEERLVAQQQGRDARMMQFREDSMFLEQSVTAVLGVPKFAVLHLVAPEGRVQRFNIPLSINLLNPAAQDGE
jgi:hypothetical protein